MGVGRWGIMVQEDLGMDEDVKEEESRKVREGCQTATTIAATTKTTSPTSILKGGDGKEDIPGRNPVGAAPQPVPSGHTVAKKKPRGAKSSLLDRIKKLHARDK